MPKKAVQKCLKKQMMGMEKEKEKEMGKIFEEDQQVLIFQYNQKNQFSSFSTHFSALRLSYFQLELQQKKQTEKKSF